MNKGNKQEVTKLSKIRFLMWQRPIPKLDKEKQDKMHFVLGVKHNS